MQTMASNFLALNVPLVPLPEGSAAFEAGAAPPWSQRSLHGGTLIAVYVTMCHKTGR